MTEEGVLSLVSKAQNDKGGGEGDELKDVKNLGKAAKDAERGLGKEQKRILTRRTHYYQAR